MKRHTIRSRIAGPAAWIPLLVAAAVAGGSPAAAQMDMPGLGGGNFGFDPGTFRQRDLEDMIGKSDRRELPWQRQQTPTVKRTDTVEITPSQRWWRDGLDVPRIEGLADWRRSIRFPLDGSEDGGVPYTSPLPQRPTRPLAIPGPGIDRREAEPGGGTAGVIGTPSATGSGLGADDAIVLVRASSVPQAVKDRLSSDAHRAFIERCQPPTLELRDWREKMARQLSSLRRPDDAETLDAALAASDAAEQRRLSGLFRTYTGACLVPWQQTSDPRLKRFIEDRVGLIRGSDGGPLCTATLVTPNTVVTARHCVGSPLDETVVRDLTLLTFARVSDPKTATPLTTETLRTEYYRERPTLAFDRGELQSDMVVLRLSRPVLLSVASAWQPLAVAEPDRYAQLHAVVFNLYSYRAATILGGSADWQDHMYVDSSATCIAAGRFGPRLLLHACQTEGASSGAPLVMLPGDGGPVALAATNAGGFSRKSTNPDVWSEIGIDTLLVPNHAVVLSGLIRDRIRGWVEAARR